MRLCSSLPANRSVCARRARGEEVCRSRWTEHPPGGDFHLAISGDFEMAIDNIEANDDATGPPVVTTLKSCRYAPAPTLDSTLRLESYKHLTGEIATGPGLVV